MKKVLSLFGISFLSGVLFLVVASLTEYVIANYVSAKPSWPDEQSLLWTVSLNMFVSITFIVPLMIGAALSWRSFKAANGRTLLVWAASSAVVSALIYAIAGRSETSSDPRIAFGLLMAWPLLVLAISALTIRYGAAKNGN